MTLFTEIIPILAFFITYQLYDLYVATIVSMAISILPIIHLLFTKQSIPLEKWLHMIGLLTLGITTVVFKNSNFIKWKPTIGYSIIASTFILTPYRQGATLFEISFSKILYASKGTWRQLNRAWIAFFCSMGILNLIIAHTTSTSTWVYFKLFGTFGLTILFIIGQIIYLFLSKKIKFHHEYK